MYCELTKDDIEKLESAISISESILDTYKLLADLEINDKYNTTEYINAMKCLNSSRALETSLLEIIIKDKRKSVASLNYIENKYKVNPATNLDDILLCMNDKDRSKLRVARKIRDVIMEKEEDVISLLPPELQEFLKENCIEDATKTEIKDVRTIITSIKTLNTDNISFILNKLENKINSPFYKSIKNELIKIKYLIIYMNEEESGLLKESSNVINKPTEIFFTGEFVLGLNKMDSEFLKLLRISYSLSESLKQIKNLLAITDRDYQSLDKQLETEIREIILRLTLQYMTEEDLELTNDTCHNIIDAKEYTETIIADKIISAYKSYNKDKASIRRISLKI